MLALIRGGEVFTPEHVGPQDVLVMGGTIARLGEIDQRAVEGLGVPVEIIDATGCVVTPGLVDAHEHLAGGSGERGFASQTPAIELSELVSGGITTVVGCLGVDTDTSTMEALIGRAKGLTDEGLTAYVYSGGYDVPPSPLTRSVRTDLLFVSEVIGAGEIAISDRRSMAPAIAELARLVHDTSVGGLLTGKAGVTHFHVGDGAAGLTPIRELIRDYEIDPAWLYPTHVARTPALLQEAADLTRHGVTVDIDVVDEQLARWLRAFDDGRGDRAHLTASSDASISSPATLLAQVRSCVTGHGMDLAAVLPLVTANPARVLKLTSKGRLAAGADADLLVLRRDSLDLVAVMAKGRVLLRDGRLHVREAFLEGSNRRRHWHGSTPDPIAHADARA